MRNVDRVALLGVALVWAAPAWAAARPLEVSIYGSDPPFSEADLDAAIDARKPSREAHIDIVVSGEDLLLRFGDRERRVVIGEREGPDAARVVAQEIGDLVLEVPAATTTVDLVADEHRSAPDRKIYVALLPSIGVSISGDSHSLGSIAGDVDVPIGGGFRVAAQGAYFSTPIYSAVSVRPSLGLEIGPVEMRVGVLVSWMRIYGDLSTLAGAQAALLLHFPITGPLTGVAEVGADAYVDQVLLSPSVIIRSGMGLAWAFR